MFIAQNNRNLTISQAIVNVINEENQHEWTQEDIEEANDDLRQGLITSVYITTEQNLRPAIIARLRSHQSPTLSIRPENQSIRPENQSRPVTPQSFHTTVPERTERVQPLPPPPNRRPEPEKPFTLKPDPVQPADTSVKLISEITKIYRDDHRYDGSNGSFDQKLRIFYDIYNRVKLPREETLRAFPVMLKGLAQDHFYNNELSDRTFQEVCDNIRNFFEGPGYFRKNLDIWNSVTLTTISAENPSKTTYEHVQLMINKLRQV